ncbi:MAG: TonB-dependent receptor [Alphaproteobacteria bacterium]|jgi:iron complex outermembrane receptor protein
MKTLLLASACALAFGPVAWAATILPDTTVSPVDVIATVSHLDLATLPNTRASVTAEEIVKTINVFTPEDTLRYLPSLTVRSRHVGDTQSPVATRTSGLGASARSLIYVDGVLISSLIGNNNTSASPKWGLVSPEAIERIDVLYGPFSAAFAGNSIGTVIAFTQRMPAAFAASAQIQGQSQTFSKYGEEKSYGTGRVAASLGDRFGDLAFRVSYNHLDANSQPLTYATATVPTAASTAGTPVTGAFNDNNRTAVPILVLGSTGIEHQVQDNVSSRVTYALTPNIEAAYTLGLFANKTASNVNTYLRDSGGAPVWAGSINLAGHTYNVAASTFSNGVYHTKDLMLAQGVSISSHTGGILDFDLVGTRFDTLQSRQRIPGGTLPAAFSGGAGQMVSLDGTGWDTLDGTATWRPQGADGENIVKVGLHQDDIKLSSPRYGLAAWISGSIGATSSFNRGRTWTRALWAQDVWAITSELKATLGVRAESWRAYDGLNFSLSPALNTVQPEVSHIAISPKAMLAWSPGGIWTFKASVGQASRFPTVAELYQSITVGTALQVPNPNLKPETALSSELSAERKLDGGSLRVSLFEERIDDALLSQTAPLPAGATTLASFVQNVERTHAQGIEVVASKSDVLVYGLTLSGWVTYAQARTEADKAFPAAVRKHLPGVPTWRGEAQASYAASPQLNLTLAARYSDRAFSAIDNTDIYANTYQGFSGYFVADAKVRYTLSDHLAASLGVNNLGARNYFLFHPFPQRAIVADLSWSY